MTTKTAPVFLNIGRAWPNVTAGWPEIIAVNLVMSVVYFALGVGLIKLAFVGQVVVPFWPATGMDIAALWFYGPRVAAGIFLGSLAVNLTVLGGRWPSSLMVAASNMMAPMLSTWFLRRILRTWRDPREFRRVLVFTLVAVMGTASFGASIGSLSLILLDHEKSALAPMWGSWFMGDSIGTLMTAPMLLLAARRRLHLHARAALEIVLFGLAAGAVMAGFTLMHSATLSVELYKLFTFIFILSAAARYGMLGAAVSAFLAAFGTVGVSLLVFGPFVRSTMFESFALFYSSLVLQAIAGLLLAAALADLTTAARSEKAAREAAEVASAHRIRLLTSISHDVRTPLAGIMGVLQTLQRAAPGQDRSRLVGLALRAGDTLSQIVSDILEAARLEAGRITAQPAPFEAARSIADVVALGRGKAAAKGLAVEVSGLETLPARVVGDRVRFEQILGNLVDNAIEYTAVGAVRVSARQDSEDPDRLVVEVADTGPGLRPDQVSAMLANAVIAQQAGQRAAGLGIGLQNSHRLAKLLGGAITYRPAEGGGSVFKLALLLLEAEAASVAAEPAPTPPRGILLVEDDPISCEVTAALLRSYGHSVMTADGIVEATRLASEHCYDLVLTDVSLAGGGSGGDDGGLDVARFIRALPVPAGATPIIALTAEGRSEIHATYRAAGVDGVIVKPLALSIDLDTLLREARW